MAAYNRHLIKSNLRKQRLELLKEKSSLEIAITNWQAHLGIINQELDKIEIRLASKTPEMLASQLAQLAELPKPVRRMRASTRTQKP